MEQSRSNASLVQLHWSRLSTRQRAEPRPQGADTTPVWSRFCCSVGQVVNRQRVGNPLRILIAGLCLSALLAAAGSNDARLSEAAMRGDNAAVRTLIDQKADLDGTQGDGSTALHWAAFHDDLDLVKLLLASGANAKAATREG